MLVLKWKITCMSDWSSTSSMFELMVNGWWLDWYWCVSIHRHPTSCCSAAELMSVLFFHTMRYKAKDPRNPSNDRFILSKVGCRSVFGYELPFSFLKVLNVFHPSCYCFQGHAAPILYAAWAEAGFIKESELLNLRKIDSDLEGHPTPVSKTTLITANTLAFKRLGSVRLF